MLAIAAIGLLTIVLSLVMIASPSAWSRGILAFEQKPWFHAAEVASRLGLGAVLVVFAGRTGHPGWIGALGWLLMAVGAGLFLMGETRHRAFARRSATFTRIFRPAGGVSLALGVFIVFTALGSAG